MDYFYFWDFDLEMKALKYQSLGEKQGQEWGRNFGKYESQKLFCHLPQKISWQAKAPKLDKQ